MTPLDTLLDELVTANRVLAREEVVDSFGHISARHPERPDRFLLSRARAPDCIEREDLMEFTLQGDCCLAHVLVGEPASTSPEHAQAHVALRPEHKA